MEVMVFDKFEYIYKTYMGSPIKKIIEDMNELGKEGWEVIFNLKDDFGRNTYIFKRKIKTLAN